MQNYFKSFYEKVNPESLILLIMSKRNFSPDRLCNPDMVDLRYARPCDRFSGAHCQTYCAVGNPLERRSGYSSFSSFQIVSPSHCSHAKD